MSRPYLRFLQILDAISEARAKEVKEKMIEGAWIAWQLKYFDPPVKFSEYLDALNLGEKTEVIKAEQALDKAQSALDKLKGVDVTHEF